MQALLDSLDYDFSQFTLEDFVSWLEWRRGRKIKFVAQEMPATLHGAWLKGIDEDFVFFEANTPALHQAHNQLHEMSHMLCGHPTLEVGPEQVHLLLRHTGSTLDPAALDSFLLRSVYTDLADQEAEMLTALIQERVMRHARLDELYKVVSSEGGFANYFAAYVERMEGYR